MARGRLSEDETVRLRKIGFELRAPVDEYSEQPGSGGVIGGRRGVQEYGIEGGPAQEDGHDRDLTSNVDINSADIEIEGTRFPQEVIDKSFPGMSQYSSAHISASEGLEASRNGRNPAYEQGEGDGEGDPISQPEVEALLLRRLQAHPLLKKEAIKATFDGRGRLTLGGVVHSEAIKIDAQEVCEAVLGHNYIDNRLEVAAARTSP